MLLKSKIKITLLISMFLHDNKRQTISGLPFSTAICKAVLLKKMWNSFKKNSFIISQLNILIWNAINN